MELEEAVKFLKHHRRYLNGAKVAKVKPKVLDKAIGVILKEIKEIKHL